jgi:hypothetical protein
MSQQPAAAPAKVKRPDFVSFSRSTNHICSSLPHEVTLQLYVLKDELQLIWAQLPYKTQSPSISSVIPHINKTATMTTVS